MKQITDTDKPYIVAVDTSGRQGSVACLGPKEELVTHTFTGPMRHAAELLPSLASVVRKAGGQPDKIGLICVTTGPGSFTGLRIAVSFAKMASMANRAHIVGVNTLDATVLNADSALRDNIVRKSRIGVVLDAKRGQFFAGVYEPNQQGWNPVASDLVITPEEFLRRFAGDANPDIALLGEGLAYYKDRFRCKGVDILDHEYWACRAENVLKAGIELAKNQQFCDPVRLVPSYFRSPDAREKTKNP